MEKILVIKYKIKIWEKSFHRCHQFIIKSHPQRYCQGSRSGGGRLAKGVQSVAELDLYCNAGGALVLSRREISLPLRWWHFLHRFVWSKYLMLKKGGGIPTPWQAMKNKGPTTPPPLPVGYPQPLPGPRFRGFRAVAWWRHETLDGSARPSGCPSLSTHSPNNHTTRRGGMDHWGSENVIIMEDDSRHFIPI